MSLQYEEDNLEDSFQAILVIQNDSSFDLALKVKLNNNTTLLSQYSSYINVNSSKNRFILPSELETLQSIRLYSSDDYNNLILVYDQNPINNEL